MKVLWFANTPSLAEEKIGLKPSGGGWIKSLERELIKFDSIELGIIFYCPKKIENFKINRTSYFPVFQKPRNKLQKIYARSKALIEPEMDLDRFMDIIRSFKPDLIHVHGTEGPFGLVQKFSINIPVFVSIQGCLTVYQYKFFSGIPKSQVIKSTNLIDRLLSKGYLFQYKTFVKRAERESQILQLSKNIIGRTDWDRRISSVLSPNRKYFHLDEILRDSFYKKVWSQKPFLGEIKIFTTTGRNVFKGLEVVLKAVHILNDIGMRFTWHVAGIENDDKILTLVSKAMNLNYPGNLIFNGVLDENKLVDQLLDSDLYVMPSHIENSPNNLCEAMILGLPCIATDSGGTSSLIKNKKEGLVIQDGDPWSLAGSVKEIFENYDEALKMGSEARKVALTRHDPKSIVNQLINIYENARVNTIVN